MIVIIANWVICKRCKEDCPGILNCLKASYVVTDLSTLEASEFALKVKPVDSVELVHQARERDYNRDHYYGCDKNGVEAEKK